MLGIDVRPDESQRFHAELVELAQAALLRALVAEHRSGVEDLDRDLLQHAAGDEGAGDSRGAFRPQRDVVAAAILEAVHLLGDDVGGVAKRALEDLGELEDGGRYLEEPVALGQGMGDGQHVPVAATLVGQNVVGPADRLQ